ncbi:uncharacterized protein BX663DRAFT_499073 [Cokeromyces recurvatus]|uniref:uncharacterized protein n=1 Tax=Cokeromyces recurvatus TaxID=90255 RepID=UPI00221F39AF|nr:uncharacterized protein BX663DRAFT_499073 [Cokeromyces recurvatus]KAI7906164.1 hypothetical protein BX663DRAFT_499073 [Cokeromyces recurvatus]
MSSILKLNIISDTDVINTFIDGNSIIPNESYVISGRVEIELAHPIQIRQLMVEFKGRIECIITSSDYFQDNTYNTACKDEIPLGKWFTITSNNELGFIDKITRKAAGQSKCFIDICHEQLILLDEPEILDIGKKSWPFSLKINNVHLLPPSLLTPHHTIQYLLSANIKLNSFRERFKISYWNALHINNRKKLKGGNSSLISPIITTVSQSSSLHHHNNRLPFTVIEDTSNNNNTVNYYLRNNKRQLLHVTNMIQICRHTYPSLYSLYSVPRVRYRGCRQGRIQYEVGLSKFTCLQKRGFPFVCTFNSISEDAIIDTLEYYLEQTEIYPIRAGNFNLMSKYSPDSMITRRRRFSRTKHDMNNYRNGEELKFILPLNLPHIAPQIQTDILQISHKLRLAIKFKDRKKERDMSLSFVLNLGTVPGSYSSSNHPSLSATNAIHVRHELVNQWPLITSEEEQQSPLCYEELNKLPSYQEVILEGSPPSPFLEDHY